MGDEDADAELVEQLIAGNVADVKEIIDVVARKAKAGEPSAVTELLKRLWVVPRSRLVKFPMPPLASVAGGMLTIEEGAALADILERHSTNAN